MVNHRIVLSHRPVSELRKLLADVPDEAKLEITDDTCFLDDVMGWKIVAEWQTVETDAEYNRRIEIERMRADAGFDEDMEEIDRIASKYRLCFHFQVEHDNA